MMRRLFALVLLAGALLATGGEAAGQTRADSAAVLLNAAERLRQQGDAGAARALLQLIARDYGGTPAAGAVAQLLASLEQAPAREQSGRTELMVWGATYGAWLGVAVPLIADAESPEAFGLGLLTGAPVGFFAARGFGRQRNPTEGQARAITFGGTWGSVQGFAWAEVLDLGSETERSCISPDDCFESETGTDTQQLVAAAVAGGIAGILTGAALARKPITAGTATAVSHGGLWGGWFGTALTVIGGTDDGDNILAGALLGGNATLIASALLAPRWRLSESRARLISIAGVVGGIAGGGLVLIAQPDAEEVAIGIPLATSVLGLALGAHHTRNHDTRTNEGNAGQGALLNLNRGEWALDLPQPRLQLIPLPDRRGRRTALHLPLLKARF